MKNNLSSTRVNIRRIAVVGILSSLSVVLNYTPLAFMLVPGLPVQITLMHIPVIIGAILEGPIAGAIIGLMFGGFSLYLAFVTPLPIAVVFINPLVSVFPRILIGIAAYYVYKLFRNVFKQKNNALSVGAAAAAGSLTNTIGVLGMIYLIYGHRIVEILGMKNIPVRAVMLALALPNAPLELAASIVIIIPVVIAINRARNKL